jgi:hypothetical protein
MELTCLMCTEKEHQTWLLNGHNVDQNLYLLQPFLCKKYNIILACDELESKILSEYIRE